jgi:hypothetical protein
MRRGAPTAKATACGLGSTWSRSRGTNVNAGITATGGRWAAEAVKATNSKQWRKKTAAKHEAKKWDELLFRIGY